jgi:hypothetical protein
VNEDICSGPCHIDVYSSSNEAPPTRKGVRARGAQSTGVRWTLSVDLQVAREPLGRSICVRPETILHLEHTGLWVEVARKRLGGELAAGAGMWFAVTRGTGIWVQARKHWPNGADHGWPRVYERCACPKKSVPSAWLPLSTDTAIHGTTPPPEGSHDAAVQILQATTWRHGAFVPYAWMKGFDSVLTLCDKQPTMVLTTAATIVSASCVRGNCTNCTLMEQAMRCGPGDSTCGPTSPGPHHKAGHEAGSSTGFVMLRSGQASKPCKCDNESPSLNCGVQ